VQRRFGRGEGVEQRETGLAFDVLVVPLEQELDRDGYVIGSVAQGLVPGRPKTATVIPGSAVVNGTSITALNARL
jgi:hypothetical protein